MKTMLLAAAAACSFAAPAFAQDSDLPDPNDRSDTFTLGVGGAWIPDYEGSNDYKIIPAATVRGRMGGISFFSRATYLYVDVVPRGSGKLEFDAGPIVGARLNRTGKAKDDTVDYLNDLEDRKVAIEAGAFAGVTWHGLTNPYDALSLRVDVVKGLNAHKSTVITPTLDFGTPLSKAFYVGASASLEWAGGGYADYYFSNPAVGLTPPPILTPAAIGPSAIETLPAFDADGGFKNWRVGLLGNYALSGDLTRGWSLFGTASYGVLAGDFKRSPIVSDRGSKNQSLLAVGVGYTF